MDKVISSNITRSFNKQNDELYELLRVEPAEPIPVACVKSYTCDFRPRNDKLYIPKRKSRNRVKTVRDIRNLFEKDVLSELPAELEKQQNYILRKIKGGSLKEDKIVCIAKKMLNSDTPLTKLSWQMLMNINPEGCTNSMQYVLWNGKSIRVNGSRGGKSKFICKYDLGAKRTFKSISALKKMDANKKKGLLQNSLSVNFKPGPLTYKKKLDKSYQKHHVGHIDVVNLPRPGLEIQPLYGSALEPTISSFVNKLRDENGTISQKWAEFAVSVLGSTNGSSICQKNQDRPVTFDLGYKNDQTRLLMRRDLETYCDDRKNEDNLEKGFSERLTEKASSVEIMNDVRNIMNDLLNAVEININQNDMFTEEDEIREDCQIDQPPNNNNKEKLKRKYLELDRLDVTVIRLTENESGTENTKTCKNSYCALGCVCNSLESTLILKKHCGRIDCMFECKCDFSKFAMNDSLNDCPDLIPGLFNLNNDIKCTLSKEEQKFHQTVIVSGDKSILLKSSKRNCKSTKKYADFYHNLPLKSKTNVKPILTIIAPKLNCKNIEPLCMVHNLYKCFCKGRFTESILNEVIDDDSNIRFDISDEGDKVNIHDEKKRNKGDHFLKTNQTSTERETLDKVYEIDSDDETYSSARVKPYEGRKYSDGYYLAANSKIQEMEVNDTKLRKRLLSIVGNSCDNSEQNAINTEDNTIENNELVPRKEETHKSPIKSNPPTSSKILMIDECTSDRQIASKPKLVAWLETSYQQYKRRLDMGIMTNALEPPKKGKVALYPWDFILKRYSERKNLFLVSKSAPFRIFMAVNSKNPLFENCINIDDIRFADLNKYPTTVKNLLTNTNNMKDYFCILYGYNYCWEFIGTVTKVTEQKDSAGEETKTVQEQDISSTTNEISSLVDFDASNSSSSALEPTESEPENTPKKSKWFIMTVEDDFTEIQFYNRGFFVTFKSIIKAINVARLSGKTVRLTSQVCANNDGDGTQFGIYAIPNANEYCVFIGPYEVNEPLGVETIKSMSNVGNRKKTRGVWITTDKVDNLKVIDNPLSFIPSSKAENCINVESLEKNVNISLQLNSNENADTEKVDPVKLDISANKSPKNKLKVVKPIKIRKSNGFYHLGSNSILTTVSVLKSPTQLPGLVGGPTKTYIIKPSTSSTNLTEKPVTTDSSSAILSPLILTGPESQALTTSQLPLASVIGATANRGVKRPVAEVAPQIKISAVYSEFDPEKNIEPKRREGGMFILKPEEINQRLVIDGNKSPKAGSSTYANNEDQEIAMDIEHFLDTSTVCPAPDSEAYVISDDEDLEPIPEKEVKEIFIECTNIEHLGAIRGEMDSTKGVRFEFPGFKISDFYEPAEVFTKINQ